ncbi:MAG: hypothetical protein O2887_06280 [Bacteroidetes bacterium]|nr:hypothetical protein [Bacteroidota bacterium]MDA1120089.1 hypothetical protein [Bacteroidota bacterium]
MENYSAYRNLIYSRRSRFRNLNILISTIGASIARLLWRGLFRPMLGDDKDKEMKPWE